jgi:hypothetical protein
VPPFTSTVLATLFSAAMPFFVSQLSVTSRSESFGNLPAVAERAHREVEALEPRGDLRRREPLADLVGDAAVAEPEVLHFRERGGVEDRCEVLE